MAFQLGDHVRFRGGKAIEAMRGRKRHVGVIVALVPELGPEPWPVVQFNGYRTAALQSGMLEGVEGSEAAREDPEAAC